jgi:hypothetical protein
MSRRIRVHGVWVALAMLTAWLGAACITVDLDDEPPYPPRDKDYTPTVRDVPPPPWTNPEDYPYVTITSPVNGAFVTPGALEVTGTYAGPDLARLTLNGESLALNGSAFSGTITIEDGAAYQPIKVTATTAEDDFTSSDLVTVFTGVPALPGATVDVGGALDLENPGLDAVSDALADALDGMDLAPLLGSLLDPLVIDKAVIQGLDILLQATENGVSLQVVAASLDLEASLLFIPLTLEIEGLMISMVVDVNIDGDTHQATVQVVDSAVTIGSLNIGFGLLDELVSYVVGLVLDLLVQTQIPGLLEDAINNLVLTIDGNGYSLSLLPAAAVSTTRNFSFGLDALLEVTDAGLWNPDFQPEGYRTTPSPVAGFPEKTPVTEKPYGLCLGLNDDFLNQVFYALSATNSLNFELTDEILRAEILSILFFSFESIDPDTPVVLRLRPSVAPLTVGDAETQAMSLVLPAFLGEIFVDRGGGDLWEALTFSIDLNAPLVFDYNEDGSISLLLDEFDLALEIVHNPIGQKNVDNVERLLAEITQSLLPDLLATLTQSLELGPLDLLGLEIALVDVATYGAQNDNVGVFIDVK